MQYIAHIRESDGEVQSVEEHLLGVRSLAESYGESVGIKHLAGLAGLLHDMGKFTIEFREYILEAVNNPKAPSKRGSVDHSTAGGKLLYKLLHGDKDPYKKLVAEIVGNAIISHHGYLKDYLNPDVESKFLQRVCDKHLDEYEDAKTNFFTYVIDESDFITYVNEAIQELKIFLHKNKTDSIETKVMFLTKFVFSALIDADRTNSRMFEEKEVAIHEPKKGLFKEYYEKLICKTDSFSSHVDALSPINQLRQSMSEQCDQFAYNPSGIYTLSIPTGGGKTLASLRYALKHANVHGKKRIIYIVPFTTIIEQNAEEIRSILNDDANILEHHSNVIEEEEDQNDRISNNKKLKLAKDNWDSPIIFTTMVQFLNVIYEKGTRNIRRLHNLRDAVLIFDEVQKVPIKCVSLFNQALNYLKGYANASIVLCTATQPALDFVEQRLNIEKNGEIIKDLPDVINAFKRVDIIDLASDRVFSNEQLAQFVEEKIEDVQNILIILNTKKVVRELYNRLLETSSDVHVFHLSTSMCAAHRKELLKEIRGKLKNDEKIICISTQLIEA